MERMTESANSNIEKEAGGFLRAAAEGFLANLPILVCGMVVGFTVVSEIFVG